MSLAPERIMQAAYGIYKTYRAKVAAGKFTWEGAIRQAIKVQASPAFMNHLVEADVMDVLAVMPTVEARQRFRHQKSVLADGSSKVCPATHDRGRRIKRSGKPES